MKDHCDRDGAAALMERIRDYWAARGRTARLYMSEQAFDPAMRSRRVDIRSDMVNGMPQRQGAAAGRGVRGGA
ncbi:phosphoglycolate phosphatase [Euryhalocaulis caribicus]|uniref:phosphoglycolate phosphatase n=1 Tax=Euryhalocaulis caribicus TaxID=1161401 RepID=UPI0003A206DC|nr:phosphoglycolate phosphatase [Euryhalocaulis caribicus]